MNDPKPTAHQQALARQRAQLIMQVQNGLLSAQEAARQLGISRKTYYLKPAHSDPSETVDRLF